jgi:hypothetical protein
MMSEHTRLLTMKKRNQAHAYSMNLTLLVPQ